MKQEEQVRDTCWAWQVTRSFLSNQAPQMAPNAKSTLQRQVKSIHPKAFLCPAEQYHPCGDIVLCAEMEYSWRYRRSSEGERALLCVVPVIIPCASGCPSS